MRVVHSLRAVLRFPNSGVSDKGERSMSTDLKTTGDVARSLNVSIPKAKGMLEGLEPAVTAGNGRVVLWDLSSVKRHLAERNADLLSFLGYLSPEQSYDVLVEVDA